MEYQLEKLKAGTRNFADVNFPNTETKIRIRVLTNQDVLDSSMAADNIFCQAKIEVSAQNIRVYEAEKDLQHLYRACTDLDGNPLAPTIADFRRLLTVADKAYLIDRYMELDEQCNPSPDTMTDAEFDTLVEAVKKNPDTLSNVSSITTLQRLARFLAAGLATSQTGSGHTSR